MVFLLGCVPHSVISRVFFFPVFNLSFKLLFVRGIYFAFHSTEGRFYLCCFGAWVNISLKNVALNAYSDQWAFDYFPYILFAVDVWIGSLTEMQEISMWKRNAFVKIYRIDFKSFKFIHHSASQLYLGDQNTISFGIHLLIQNTVKMIYLIKRIMMGTN